MSSANFWYFPPLDASPYPTRTRTCMRTYARASALYCVLYVRCIYGLSPVVHPTPRRAAPSNVRDKCILFSRVVLEYLLCCAYLLRHAMSIYTVRWYRLSRKPLGPDFCTTHFRSVTRLTQSTLHARWCRVYSNTYTRIRNYGI